MPDQTKAGLLGRTAYEEYCDAVGGVAFNGDPLPTWDEQQQRSPNIAEAWRRAASAAHAYGGEASNTQQIAGYRDLPQSERDAINSVKAAEVDLAALWKQLGEIPGVDGRLRAIARTHFDEGFSALVKSIARPFDPYA